MLIDIVTSPRDNVQDVNCPTNTSPKITVRSVEAWRVSNDDVERLVQTMYDDTMRGINSGKYDDLAPGHLDIATLSTGDIIVIGTVERDLKDFNQKPSFYVMIDVAILNANATFYVNMDPTDLKELINERRTATCPPTCGSA